LWGQKISLDTQTTGRDIYWDNTNKRFLIGWTGSFGDAFASRLEIKDPGPAWATWTTPHDGLRVALNAYPVGQQFFNGNGPIAEAIVGAVKIPSASVGIWASGVSGYASTSSTATGAVGVFSEVHADAASTNLYGMNTLVTNCPTHYCDNSIVKDLTNLWGVEIDFNLHKLPDLSAPTANVRGLNLIGDSQIQPLGILNAIDIDQFGITDDIPWKTGLYFNPGSVNYPIYITAAASTTGTAVYVGKTGTGDNEGSQLIHLAGRNAGGSDTKVMIVSDPDGNLVLKPDTGTVQIQDSAGTPSLTISASGVGLASVAFGSLGAAGNGTFIYCSDCNVASPCTGGGSGAWAFRSSGAWACPF
jgi:hypothetical protein